jgi:hypothetical protein
VTTLNYDIGRVIEYTVLPLTDNIAFVFSGFSPSVECDCQQFSKTAMI